MFFYCFTALKRVRQSSVTLTFLKLKKKHLLFAALSSISRMQGHKCPTFHEKGEGVFGVQCVPSIKLLNKLQFMFSSFIDFSKWLWWLCVGANEKRSYFTTLVFFRRSTVLPVGNIFSLFLSLLLPRMLTLTLSLIHCNIWKVKYNFTSRKESSQ